MAVNLRISSIVGYRNSTATIVGPEPWIETITDLEGRPGVNRPKLRKILAVSTVSDYTFTRNTTSSVQTIYLTNQGSAPLNIWRIEYGSSGVGILPYYNTNTGWTVIGNPTSINHTATIQISPGSQVSFDLAYGSTSSGTFSNFVDVISDATGGSYVAGERVKHRIFTTQNVENNFFFRIRPSSRSTTSTIYGQNTLHSFTITPINLTTSSYDFTLTGSMGFSIDSSSTSQVKVLFDNNKVNNVNGTYTATLLATAFGGINSSTVTISHTVNVDLNQYFHYGSWLSPAAPYDSVVGISYDKIDGIRTLTIGLGAGGDGSPDILNGGLEYLLLSNLGISGSQLSEPYRYWAKVYRILLTEAKTYYSADYQVKNQGIDYDQYFGENQAPESLFVIDNDQYGNVIIKINRLRVIPEDDLQVATTVQNLSRVFYYYSEADIGGRYYQLGSAEGDGTQTRLFIGFNNDGSTATSLVSYPL